MKKRKDMVKKKGFCAELMKRNLLFTISKVFCHLHTFRYYKYHYHLLSVSSSTDIICTVRISLCFVHMGKIFRSTCI